jgi:aerobic carbon-monoxide dehydrogenase medium subunit
VIERSPPLAVHRSRKLIPEFRLHRPRSAAEAVAMKAAAGPGGVFMAGGIDVVNRMKFGAPVTDVIHLAGVGGLDEIAEERGGLRLGAMVSHDRLATSPLVRSRLPDLAQTWPEVANIRIRCKGTIGGNIMARDTGYDFALAAMAADARLHFLTADGDHRVVNASQPDAAPEDGLLTAVTMPCGSGLRLLFDRALRPVVSLALGLDVADGRIAGGRVAIGCAYRAPIVARLRPLAQVGESEEVARIVAAGLPEPVADHHAGSGYRRRMIEVLLGRNLRAIA